MADWVHDLGGAAGFGAVVIEPDEPVFHSDWERRVFGVTATLMLQRRWNGSEFRHAIERMEPDWYLDSSYYEHWLAALSTLLAEKGVVERDELEERNVPLSRPADPAAAEHPPPPGRPEPFAVGARVRVRELDPPGHTRCPAYIRGRVGTVLRRDGDHAVPDVEAHSDERPAEPTYSVCFAAGELWGEDAERGASVCVDLWHRYLEAAG